MGTVTPGEKTTEFWLTVVVLCVGVGLVALGVLKGNNDVLEKGLLLLGISQTAYAASRGLAKIGSGKGD